MNKIVRIILIGAFVILFGSILKVFCEEPAQPNSSSLNSQANTYEKAGERYKRGEYDKAIGILEELLKENPSSADAKNMLSEVLIAVSVEDYLLGSEEKSYRALSRALQLAPDLNAANRMYEKIRKERFSNPDSTKNSNVSLPVDAAQFQQMVTKMIQAQKELLSQNHNSLDQIIQQAGNQRKDILQSLDKREDIVMREIQYGRRASVWLIISAILGIILIVAMILYNLQKISARREKILIEQGEKFIQLVQDQSQQNLEFMSKGLKEGLEHITISANFTAPSLPSPGVSSTAPPSPAIAYDDNSASKLRKIDIIDAEIVLEGKDPVTKDQEVLYALLEDSDPAVRARTIQVLFKTNPSEAFHRVKEMLSNPLVSIRVMAIKLMSGIANPQSAEILIQLLKEPDPSIKREVITALKSLLSENLPAPAKDGIEQALSLVAEKEGWIIK